MIICLPLCILCRRRYLRILIYFLLLVLLAIHLIQLLRIGIGIGSYFLTWSGLKNICFRLRFPFGWYVWSLYPCNQAQDWQSVPCKPPHKPSPPWWWYIDYIPINSLPILSWYFTHWSWHFSMHLFFSLYFFVYRSSYSGSSLNFDYLCCFLFLYFG